MATATLGSQSVGSIVKLGVGGESRNFIVVQQGKPSAMYDSSCDGTWLLMQDIYCNKAFDGDYSMLADAALTAWLNSDFVALLDSGVQSNLLTAKIPYVPSPMGDALSGSDGLACKAFLLGEREVGLTVGAYNSGDGALLSYFTTGTASAANSRRVAKYNGTAAAWWLRSPYTLTYSSEQTVAAGGAGSHEVVTYEAGVRPAIILPASMYVTDGGSVAGSTPPSAPGYITVPETLTAGAEAVIAWAAAAGTVSALAGYRLERSTNGGASYTQIYSGTALRYTDTIDASWTRVKYRVCAYDTLGSVSGYTTSAELAVQANSAPVVTGAVENGSSLGSKSAAFSLQYTVADADADAVTAREYLDGTLKKSAAVPLGTSCSFEVTADDMLRLSNDADHTLRVVANDGKTDSEAYSVTFRKAAHTASVTLTQPITSAEPIRALRLVLEGDIPADALFSALVTNNANDAVPVWENATQAVRTAQSYAFTNQSAENGYALNFQLSVSRGASGTGGALTGIKGTYSAGTASSGGAGTGTGGTGSTGAASALDLFSVMGATANQKLWNAINAGGVYSGYNQTMALSYAECTAPDKGLGAPRYYIAYRDDYPELDDSGAETVIRDTVFKPEGEAPVLLQPLYKSGTLVFEGCTFRNVLFWFGRAYSHKFIFRNCVIEDNQYNFIQCGEHNANAEYLIEGCTFRHMRPDKDEYRADIVPQKLNGWAHGNIRCLGYDVQWTIRDTLFEDCMGRLNIFFGKSSYAGEVSAERVRLYMERCTIRATNGAGISFKGQPVSGWIRDCSFSDIGANRCTAEGYDLPADAPVHSGSGTEADPYIYECGVGGNAIFSYNSTPRHELVISGCHMARMIENGVEGNYREVSRNHIEQTGCRLSEGIWTPSTEGIYGTICACKGNVVRNPGGQKAAIIIPRGFADGQACSYEDNLLVYDEDGGTSSGSGFLLDVKRESFGYPLAIKNNTILGFAKKYETLNSYPAELGGVRIADCGEDDGVLRRADFYQNSLLGLHYEAQSEKSVVRDAAFEQLDSTGALKEWTALYGTAKVYATPTCERYVRLAGSSKSSCAALAQDYRLGSDIYLARVRCKVRSSSGRVGFAPLSVDNSGSVAAGQGELVFNPQMAVLEVPSEQGSLAFHEVTHTMAVTQNCRICILNPGFDDTAAEGDAVSQLDIKDVEVTVSRCQRGPESSAEGEEADAVFDFSALASSYPPSSALRVSYYLPNKTSAYTGTWCDATWMMGKRTGGDKGRGRIVINADATLYSALTVWYKSEFDLELGGHTLECANSEQYGFLQLFNGADVTIKGPGTIKAKNYALTLAAGCACTLAGGAAISSEGTYAISLGSGSAGARTALTVEHAELGGILAQPFTALRLALPDASASATVTRLQTNGSIIIGSDTKVMNNGASTPAEITTVKKATSLFSSKTLACTYAQGHTSAELTATGDESSVSYSYLDANSRLVSAEGTLTAAFAAAVATRTARKGEMTIRLNGDICTYSGFYGSNLGTVHLNLNGYRLFTEYQSYALYVSSNSDMTLYDRSDRGENTGEVSSTNYSAIIAGGTTARLHANGGAISQPSGNCIRAENGARVILSGEAALTGKTGVDVAKNASLTVNGGTITATSKCIQAVPAEGETAAVVIHAGKMTSDKISIYGQDVTFEAVEGESASLQGELSLTQNATIGANTCLTVNGSKQTAVKNATGLVVITYEEESEE